MREKIIEKFLSGRYYLTIVGGIVFMYVSWKRILPSEAIASIITAIFMSYFNRPDRIQNGGTNETK